MISYYTGPDVPVFLPNIFAKCDKIDPTMAERNELRKELAGLADDNLNGVGCHVQGW